MRSRSKLPAAAAPLVAALLLLALALGGGRGALAALRDTIIVTFDCCEYVPATVNAIAGDTVTWQGSFFAHPLVSEDALWPPQSSGSEFSHTFSAPGSYRFYCSLHGGPGGVGMSGIVNVAEAPGGAATFLPLVVR